MTSECNVGIERRREVLVYAVIFVIVCGSLFDIATRSEHWPFSPYPMFSGIRRNYSYDEFRLIGLTEDGEDSEIDLMEAQYIQPLNDLHLSGTFKYKPTDVTHEQYIKTVLTSILDRYEALRQAGKHHGPKLRGICLYKYHWKLDPRAGQAKKPIVRELIYRITKPE